MRRSAAFMASRSSTDRGRDSAFIGVQFRQFSPPEVSIGQAGMWNDKVAVIYLPGAEAHDVEIERARAPALGALPPLLLFYLLAGPQQRPRRESGLQQH